MLLSTMGLLLIFRIDKFVDLELDLWTDRHSAYATTEPAITHEYYFLIISVEYFVTLFQNVKCCVPHLTSVSD